MSVQKNIFCGAFLSQNICLILSFLIDVTYVPFLYFLSPLISITIFYPKYVSSRFYFLHSSLSVSDFFLVEDHLCKAS